MKMKAVEFVSLAALACAPTALALASFAPASDGPTYSVGVPPGTKISSSTAGTIYFSLEAPSTYQWSALGIGSQMAGASIFMMYPDGKGNVTISARTGGPGHVEPAFDSSLMAGVTLLEGSGVSGGVMRANIKCTTCKLASASSSTNSPWIAAYQKGGSISSTDEDISLAMHDFNTMYSFTFDLKVASLTSDANPFIPNIGGGSGSPQGSPSYSGPAGTPLGGGSPSTSGSGSNFGGFAQDFQLIPTYQKAHAILMGTSVLLLFPIGAIFMRLVGSPLLHALVQLLALCILIAGFAVGVRMADIMQYLYKGPGRTHTIFGTVIVALFLVQPFIGLAHHFLYKKSGGRTAVSHIHVWIGRIALICGAINGGLGLQLSANTKSGEIAWGVVAGVMAVLYAAFVLLKRKGGKPPARNTDKRNLSS